MKAAVVHYLVHHCGMQECDCLPRCHQSYGDIAASRYVERVTCKNCLRGIHADEKAVLKARASEQKDREKQREYIERGYRRV